MTPSPSWSDTVKKSVLDLAFGLGFDGVTLIDGEGSIEPAEEEPAGANTLLVSVGSGPARRQGAGQRVDLALDLALSPPLDGPTEGATSAVPATSLDLRAVDVPEGSRVPGTVLPTLPSTLQFLLQQFHEQPELQPGNALLVEDDSSVLRGPETPVDVAGARLEERVAAACAAHPDRIALRLPGGARLSYGELLAAAKQVEAAARRAGVEPGDIVAIVADRGADAVAAALGVLRVGGAYLPMSVDTPTLRRQQLLRLAGASFVVRPGRRFGDLDIEPCEGGGGRVDDDAAAILCTSGTTGTPKAVVISHRGIARLIDHDGVGGLLSTDTVAAMANPSFDASLWEIWPALAKGACVSIFADEEVKSPTRLQARLSEEGITALFVTTGLFNSLVRRDLLMFREMRLLGVGGEALAPWAMRSVLEAGGAPEQMINGYGPTEATTFTTTYLIEKVAEGAARIPIGVPLLDTQVAVCDQRLRLLPAGWPGELFIGGPGLALGYLDGGRLGQERFEVIDTGPMTGRWYASGDLCVVKDGFVDCLGRIDRQLKIRGYRVDPSEFEAAAMRTGLVTNAIVTAVPTATSTLLTLVATPATSATTGPVVLAALREVLPSYLLPRRCVLVDALPLNANGKVDLAAIKGLSGKSDEAELSGWSRGTLREEHAPPGVDDDVALMMKGWAEILGHRDFDEETRFDEAGGDSLGLIELAIWVAEALALPVEAVEGQLASADGLTPSAMAWRLERDRLDAVSEATSDFVEVAQGPSPTVWILCLEVVQSPLSFVAFAEALGGEHRVMCSRHLLRSGGKLHRSIRSTSLDWSTRLVDAGFSSGDLLLGSSGAAPVAFDAAAILRRRGVPPGRVLLIEPSPIKTAPLGKVWAYSLVARDLTTLRARWRGFWAWVRAGSLPDDERSWRSIMLLKIANYRLRRRKLQLPVLVLGGTESPVFDGMRSQWEPWCDDFEFVAVAGTHGGVEGVLGASNVRNTVAAMRSALGDE